MRVRCPFVLVVVLGIGVAGSASSVAQEARRLDRPVLSTGITGQASDAGLEDPQFVLSLIPVQRLILRAARGPLTGSDLASALAGIDVTPERLVRLGLLARDGDRFRLAYSVLTVEDQERIYTVAQGLGDDLADRFLTRRAAFEALWAQYPHVGLRDDLAFAIIAGMVLNWEGLKQSTRLGFRLDPSRLPGGRAYIVHSEELGADIPTEGLYWGSHTFPGPVMSFSTFGDGPSIPRLYGLPDALSEPVERGLEALASDPALRGVIQQTLVLHLTTRDGSCRPQLTGACRPILSPPARPCLRNAWTPDSVCCRKSGTSLSKTVPTCFAYRC